jgi:hypothetical protein
MHFQEGGYGDETSLVVHGPDQILMGPLNLRAIFTDVDRMRKLAGLCRSPREKAKSRRAIPVICRDHRGAQTEARW